MKSSSTGLYFENTLTYTNDFNIYKYRNYYNGGGVGLGDVNNDGLLDIYLTANLLPNRLYLNKGNFKFEDITDQAGVQGTKAWSTGVSMVDVNADGWLDIFVCNSGDVDGDNKENELFINNGDGTFTDRAEEMGLADPGFSTHAVFFDFDKDADLDVYLLNNSYRAIGSFNLKKNERPIRDPYGGDKLMKNENGSFIDVSEQAGIYGSVIGFGLGVSVSDLDKDGWLDLYISNDFFERDYIYMNNGDGTFREELEKQMRSISVASMGSDIADMNGDGFPEIFVTEMLPEGEERYKTTMTFENWDRYQYNVLNDYHHQFTRNMLHRHNGIFPGNGISFSEVGRLAGVEATDWSWSALIADFNNDGNKDLFVANGLAQDILDQDYLRYVSNEQVTRMVVKNEGVDFKQLIDIIPVNRISNYAYSGDGSLGFTDVTKEWGLHEPSHSNGAAYGDLDNDGDLDLIVNNVNMPLFVYQNNSDKYPGKNYLKFELIGEGSNTMAIGTKITLKANNQLFYQEQSLNRGFQSTVDYRINFGLGHLNKVDTVIVEWLSGKQTLMFDIAVNQTITLRESESQPLSNELKSQVPILFKETELGINFVHKENQFVDFDRNRLTYHMKSTEGPRISIGDVDDNGYDDLYIGGAKDQPGALIMQDHSGSFYQTSEMVFIADQGREDLGSSLFDANSDGYLDLYVASGGSEYSGGSFHLTDRLYFNDGNGGFNKIDKSFPSIHPVSTSTVKPADIDMDNDQDLFVGARLRPELLGVPQNGYILENDGSGNYRDVTKEVAPDLQGIGMITDAIWSDYDIDGDLDLVIVGEWMSIRLLENIDGKFKDITDRIGLSLTSGWWNTIESADLDLDGDIDFVVGNHGLNSRFHASAEEPISCYVNDFDQNGAVEQIICSYNDGVSYPVALLHDLVAQLPELKKKYLKYQSYKEQTIDQLYPKEILERSIIHQVTMLESVILINNGSDGFEIRPLPIEAQISPVYAILIEDFDKDGNNDILLGGNLYEAKPEVGRYDASYGVFLQGIGDGNFSSIPMIESGLNFQGQIRDLGIMNWKDKSIVIVARNNASLQYFEILESEKND
ncbi:MAG: VCBS repeat-containing protein [Cyclobacteriaceae bacterium]